MDRILLKFVCRVEINDLIEIAKYSHCRRCSREMYVEAKFFLTYWLRYVVALNN